VCASFPCAPLAASHAPPLAVKQIFTIANRGAIVQEQFEVIQPPAPDSSDKFNYSLSARDVMNAPDSESGDDRFWTRPARRRREPHRADRLHVLSAGALLTGICSLFWFHLLWPALLGLLLGGVIFRAATRDLARMERGSMDRDGRQKTAAASYNAAEAIYISLLSLLWGLVLSAVNYWLSVQALQ
jgi:hypothetical protein